MLLASLARKALDTLIPPRCLNCPQIVERQGALCGTCWSDLTFIEPPLCVRCGNPFPYHLAEDVTCSRCADDHPPYVQARSVLAYTEVSRHMILQLKHGDGVHMAPYFAKWLARIMPAGMDVIAPVPLHQLRLLKRTYNQSALMANHLSREVGIPTYPDFLKRRRHTPAQGGLTRKERIENMHGAFSLNKKYAALVQGKTILLLDDVYTTGATLTECTRILNQAGAGGVYVLTLARVVEEE